MGSSSSNTWGRWKSAEFIDTLSGLISLGYVLSNKVNLRKMEDVERAFFRVNAAYAHDLRDAINPGRRRDQERTRPAPPARLRLRGRFSKSAARVAVACCDRQRSSLHRVFSAVQSRVVLLVCAHAAAGGHLV